MRLLVFSDSHGHCINMKKAIVAHPEAEAVVFLGDGHENLEACKDLLKGKRIYAVKGNNDFYCEYPKNQVITENGVNIYITHGHYEYVKSTLEKLLDKAAQYNCKLALYGHTHRQYEEYRRDTYLFCPGALFNGEYGMIDITDKGILCMGTKVK